MSPDHLRSLPLGLIETTVNLEQRAGQAKVTGAGSVKVTGVASKRRRVPHTGIRHRLREGLNPEARRTRALPAKFYEEVATIYEALLAVGERRPAAVIAEATDVKVTTVHRWIKEARGRDLLGPARPGRAG